MSEVTGHSESAAHRSFSDADLGELETLLATAERHRAEIGFHLKNLALISGAPESKAKAEVVARLEAAIVTAELRFDQAINAIAELRGFIPGTALLTDTSTITSLDRPSSPLGDTVVSATERSFGGEPSGQPA